MSDRCDSCGKLFTDHAGIIGTCAKARRARIRVRVLEMAIRRGLQAVTLEETHRVLNTIPKDPQ